MVTPTGLSFYRTSHAITDRDLDLGEPLNVFIDDKSTEKVSLRPQEMRFIADTVKYE